MSEHRSHPPSAPRSAARGLALAVVGCVVAAAILLLASGQGWLQVALPARAPLPAAGQTFTGEEVVAWLVPVGILVGAAGLALIATRRIGRLLVACIVVLAGLAVLAAVGYFLYDDGSLQAARWAQARAGTGESLQADREVSTGPAVFALSGGVAAVTVGLFALARSGFWPVMGARFQRRVTSSVPGSAGRSVAGGTASSRPPAGADEAAMWAALERGEDPTAVPGLARTTDALETTRDK